MSITIRPATADDAEIIVSILIQTKEQSLPHLITEHDRNRAFFVERWRKYIVHGSTAQKSKGDGFAFVAEVDGEPVGFAAYHHTSRYDAEAELESIYVLPHAQNLGVGSALLFHIVRLLQDEGTRSLCVGYDPNNPYIRFYRKMGAVEINPHWAMWTDLQQFQCAPLDPSV